MRHGCAPEVGMWFTNVEYPSSFEVVATDEQEGFVEIQHFSGEIEEIDLESWFELQLEPIPTPEDWTGPYEISREDLSYNDESFRLEDWSAILTQLDIENK